MARLKKLKARKVVNRSKRYNNKDLYSFCKNEGIESDKLILRDHSFSVKNHQAQMANVQMITFL